MSYVWARTGWVVPKAPKPKHECIDGTPPEYLTCDGAETFAPEPYLAKVLGDKRKVYMCEVHRANSQRDADEALIVHEDIKFPRYQHEHE